MRVLILGAGQVGTSLIQFLSEESHDISVIEINPDKANDVDMRYDVNVINDNALLPDILQVAGAMEADALISLTSSDETNIMACQICHHLFNVPIKIARIRHPNFIKYAEQLFDHNCFMIDGIITPESIVASHLKQLIEHPNLSYYLNLHARQLALLQISINDKSPLKSLTFGKLSESLSAADSAIVAVVRKKNIIDLGPQDPLLVGDELFLICREASANKVIAQLEISTKPVKNIMIAGGGHIGKRLARAIQSRYQVKIIESNEARVQAITSDLKDCDIYLGDATDVDLLKEEHVDKTDIFLALTQHDDTNLISSMLANYMGAKRVITLINQMPYFYLLKKHIDPHQSVIFPGMLVASQVLPYFQESLKKSYPLPNHSLVLEIMISSHSKLFRRSVNNVLKNTHGVALTFAIIRNGQPILAHQDILLEEGDLILIFLVHKKHLSSILNHFN